ncbi:solute carrier organic anion transporter family member 5A1 [Trichonephila clavata]|uniref:Solute carrier organic anion transporter family member 5A1 n=1 Tax=Trichonephila clavata TaxID=2740835 RepID=A0A8X6GYD6_TRICU|nr:solute carrier organic anion transporter family member 5A1 [Trichonephila clavata]
MNMIPVEDYHSILEKEYFEYSDSRCSRLKAKWKSLLSNPNIYWLIFHVIEILENSYFTYFIGILTTLEKRFEYDSKVSGIVLIADNICGILLSLILVHLPGKRCKSRNAVFSSLIVSMSCLMCTIPYFIFGPAHFSSRGIHALESKKKSNCYLGVEETENFVKCTAIVMLFFSNFLRGLGKVVFEKKISFYCDVKNATLDEFYEWGDPHQSSVGWDMVVRILHFWCSHFLYVFTVLLAFSQRASRRFSRRKGHKVERKNTQIKSITFQVNGFAGYFVFMPKFMESQYQQSASEASLFSGTTGIISMLVGVLIGGFLIKKFKPRPRYLTAYMVLVEIFSVLGLFVSIFLGCDRIMMPGTTVNEDQTLNLYNECNAGCGCTRRVFEPVCGADGVSTFFSPCFAGCPNMTGVTSTLIQPTISTLSNTTIFSDCKCVTNSNSTFEVSNVISGFCDSGCTMFMAYIILLCISKFISSTARVGNTLITFRCVDAKDKSFALGVFGSILAMFAFIPYPLIYGALTDSTCLVWEESCNKTGNCWLYDSDKFRYYLHGMSILLISIGICFDIVVFFLSDRLTNFYGEDDEDKPTEDRLARWIKDEEEEDIIFTKISKQDPVVEMNPVL